MLSLIRYLNGQVFVRVTAICCNDFDFCRALICWGKCADKWLLTVMAVIKMEKMS
jgi:hypothetical protein